MIKSLGRESMKKLFFIFNFAGVVAGDCRRAIGRHGWFQSDRIQQRDGRRKQQHLEPDDKLAPYAVRGFW